jgi:exosortase
MDETRKNSFLKRPLFLMVLMAVVIGIFYAPMFINLYKWWDSNLNYEHAIFIPLASVYLIWRKRKSFKTIPQKPQQGQSVFLFVIGFLMYLVGSSIEMFRLCIISFLIILLAFILLFYGKKMVKELIFPISFMLFMIPIPRLDDLTAPMKLMASKVSAGFLSLVGLPVYREGNIIFLPKFTLEVATACSGLKSLILITTLSVFYGYLVLPKVSQRIVLFALSIPIAIVANITRIITIGLMAEIITQKALFNFVHDFSGIFVFIVAGILLALAGRVVERW